MRRAESADRGDTGGKRRMFVAVVGFAGLIAGADATGHLSNFKSGRSVRAMTCSTTPTPVKNTTLAIRLATHGS